MENVEIVVLGAFVADAAFRASRQPEMGETLIGDSFVLGPGGKGSNQAVAAARLGSRVGFISRIGQDAFGRMALDMWDAEGIVPMVHEDPGEITGCAYIYIDTATGNNAIIVVPGAAMTVSVADMVGWKDRIAGCKLFMTQLETPVEASLKGLELARGSGVATLFNPAPAIPLGGEMLRLCDYVIPNESEASILTGISEIDPGNAGDAARKLQDMGAKTVILTLGENGAYVNTGEDDGVHVPALHCGAVVETTGAGDSFCGAFAHALVNGTDSLSATRYAVAAASLSVTRPGTAPAMPTSEEVEVYCSL